MIELSYPFYLASKSPRRKSLLKNIYSNITLLNVWLEEEHFNGSSPSEIALNLAKEKMEMTDKTPIPGIILTADTIVVNDNEIMGKPENENDAYRMLRELSGKTHSVITAYNMVNQVTVKSILDYEKTEVTFKVLNEKEIWDYIKTESPFDKAGAYGIQDSHGSVFVSKINGCYYNVMGLPVSKIYSSILEII